MRNLVVFIIFSFIHVGVKAGVLLDAGGTYLSDSIITSSENSSTKYGYTAGALFTINKNWWAGISYFGYNFSQTIAKTTTALSGTNVGPTVMLQFGRGNSYSLAASYNIMANAVCSEAAGSQEWTGTSYNVRFGYMPEVKEKFRVGFTVNYFSATYTKSKSKNVETIVSYSRQWLYPAIGLIKEF